MRGLAVCEDDAAKPGGAGGTVAAALGGAGGTVAAALAQAKPGGTVAAAPAVLLRLRSAKAF